MYTQQISYKLYSAACLTFLFSTHGHAATSRNTEKSKSGQQHIEERLESLFQQSKKPKNISALFSIQNDALQLSATLAHCLYDLSPANKQKLKLTLDMCHQKTALVKTAVNKACRDLNAETEAYNRLIDAWHAGATPEEFIKAHEELQKRVNGKIDRLHNAGYSSQFMAQWFGLKKDIDKYRMP